MVAHRAPILARKRGRAIWLHINVGWSSLSAAEGPILSEVEGALLFQVLSLGTTFMTTFPFLCPLSTYR
jgi:hypothetical protein